ncbi:hypothetical protein K7432_004375 [Basidiobolus ranarum]|uniref:Velvet domain-containing protein n=1 Tax=Basidiobolus ranarum TaxID=34480 RepID=A0ABR2W4Q4_9FUNG
MTNTTGAHRFVNIDEGFKHDLKNYTLVIRQQPKRAKVSSAKDKIGEKPIDPPPIVQVTTGDDVSYDNNLLQNPSLFATVTLVGPEDVMDEAIPPFAISGTLSSSIHKLKDIDNTDGGFFIFPEVVVRVQGDYRLRFRLYEVTSGKAILLKSICSDIFRVYPSKFFPGMDESTFLSRSFSDQGARIRIRRSSKVTGKSYGHFTAKRKSSIDYLPSKHRTSHSPDSQLYFDLTSNLNPYDGKVASYSNMRTASTSPTLTPTAPLFSLPFSRVNEPFDHMNNHHLISNAVHAPKSTYECPTRDCQFFGSLFESYLVRNDIPLSERNTRS